MSRTEKHYKRYDARCRKARFTQTKELHCCGRDDPRDSRCEEIDVRLDDAGGGPYLVIRADDWSINPEDVDEFCKRLKRIMRQGEKAHRKLDEALR